MIDISSLPEAFSAVSAVIAVAALLHIQNSRAKRRTAELIAARQALKAHYEAVSRIIDDPAMPTSAINFLTMFTHALSHREICNGLIDALTAPGSNGEASEVVRDMEAVAKSRPDLVENFHMALANGIIAIFVRWPGNAARLPKLLEAMGAGKKKEVQIAINITRKSRAFVATELGVAA